MVESVKAASEVYAPVSGEVVEVNQALEDDPALVNREPTGAGWFLKLRMSAPGELDGLMDEGPTPTTSPASARTRHAGEAAAAGRGPWQGRKRRDDGTGRVTEGLEQADAFVGRHIGPREDDVAAMLETVGHESLEALVDAAVPASIRAGIPRTFRRAAASGTCWPCWPISQAATGSRAP